MASKCMSKLRQILQKVKSCDILAEGVGLSVEGQSGVKSLVGVLLSILCIAAFLAGSIYHVMQSLRDDMATIVQQTSYTSDYPKINLIDDKKFPGIMFLKRGVLMPVEEIGRHVSVFAYQARRTYPNDDFSAPPTFQYSEIPMVACKSLTLEEKTILGRPQTEIEENVLNANGVCPEFSKIKDSLTVSGKNADKELETIVIVVAPCSTDLFGAQCVPYEEIADVEMFMLPNLMNLDLANRKEPASNSYNADQDFIINPSMVQRVTNRLRMVEISDYFGMFSAVKTTLSQSDYDTQRAKFQGRDFTKIACTSAEIVDGTCKPYIELIFTSGGTKVAFTRTYPGFMEVIGDIGGIQSIIFLVGSYLYAFYNPRVVREQLVKSVFNIDTSDQNKQESSERPQRSPNQGKQNVNPYLDSDQPDSQDKNSRQPKSSTGCCRKKQDLVSASAAGQADNANPAPNEFDEDEAYEQIEKNLDVVNLIRKLNFIEVLLKFFRIEDEHLDRISQASYALQIKSTEVSQVGAQVRGVATGVLHSSQPAVLPPPAEHLQNEEPIFAEIPSEKLTPSMHIPESRDPSPGLGTDAVDRGIHRFGENKPRDDLMKELMTFISAQSAWAAQTKQAPRNDSSDDLEDNPRLPGITTSRDRLGAADRQ